MNRTLLLVVSVCLLAACGGESGNSEPAPAAQVGMGSSAGSEPPPASAPAAAAPAAAPAESAAAPAARQPAGVIASTDGELPGVTIDVTQLRRDRGNTVTLRFTLRNDSAEPVKMYSNWLGDASYGSDYRAVGGIHLLDPVNNQKIFVVRDSENTCVCSRDVQDVEPGSSVNLWAKFPAPPPDVQAVTVVVPHFIPMDEVPIQP